MNPFKTAKEGSKAASEKKSATQADPKRGGAYSPDSEGGKSKR